MIKLLVLLVLLSPVIVCAGDLRFLSGRTEPENSGLRKAKADEEATVAWREARDSNEARRKDGVKVSESDNYGRIKVTANGTFDNKVDAGDLRTKEQEDTTGQTQEPNEDQSETGPGDTLRYIFNITAGDGPDGNITNTTVLNDIDLTLDPQEYGKLDIGNTKGLNAVRGMGLGHIGRLKDLPEMQALGQVASEGDWTAGDSDVVQPTPNQDPGLTVMNEPAGGYGFPNEESSRQNGLKSHFRKKIQNNIDDHLSRPHHRQYKMMKKEAHSYESIDTSNQLPQAYRKAYKKERFYQSKPEGITYAFEKSIQSHLPSADHRKMQLSTGPASHSSLFNNDNIEYFNFNNFKGLPEGRQSPMKLFSTDTLSKFYGKVFDSFSNFAALYDGFSPHNYFVSFTPQGSHTQVSHSSQAVLPQYHQTEPVTDQTNNYGGIHSLQTVGIINVNDEQLISNAMTQPFGQTIGDTGDEQLMSLGNNDNVQMVQQVVGNTDGARVQFIGNSDNTRNMQQVTENTDNDQMIRHNNNDNAQMFRQDIGNTNSNQLRSNNNNGNRRLENQNVQFHHIGNTERIPLPFTDTSNTVAHSRDRNGNQQRFIGNNGNTEPLLTPLRIRIKDDNFIGDANNNHQQFTSDNNGEHILPRRNNQNENYQRQIINQNGPVTNNNEANRRPIRKIRPGHQSFQSRGGNARHNQGAPTDYEDGFVHQGNQPERQVYSHEEVREPNAFHQNENEPSTPVRYRSNGQSNDKRDLKIERNRQYQNQRPTVDGQGLSYIRNNRNENERIRAGNRNDNRRWSNNRRNDQKENERDRTDNHNKNLGQSNSGQNTDRHFTRNLQRESSRSNNNHKRPREPEGVSDGHYHSSRRRRGRQRNRQQQQQQQKANNQNNNNEKGGFPKLPQHIRRNEFPREPRGNRNQRTLRVPSNQQRNDRRPLPKRRQQHRNRPQLKYDGGKYEGKGNRMATLNQLISGDGVQSPFPKDEGHMGYEFYDYLLDDQSSPPEVHEKPSDKSEQQESATSPDGDITSPATSSQGGDSVTSDVEEVRASKHSPPEGDEDSDDNSHHERDPQGHEEASSDGRADGGAGQESKLTNEAQIV